MYIHVEGGGGGGFKSIENVDPRYETRAVWAAVHYDMKHKKKTPMKVDRENSVYSCEYTYKYVSTLSVAICRYNGL